MTKKTRNFILIISVVLLFLIGLILYGRIFWFFETIKSVQSFIAYKFDINKNIVLALSFPIAILYFKFGILNLFSIKKSKQWNGLYVHSGFMMLFYICMFLFPRESNFNPITGESLKCFTRYGGKLYPAECDWEVHENYGTPVFKSNEKIIKEWENQEKLNNSKGPNDPYKILEETESKYKSLE
jgi:hypothetical protein